ncbi:restriction endonuclease subunit S [Leptothoe spongobia]|uniref:Restriction endonuclease subunit S n=1 Tax=Leptothoe spongobia TAU-MAC 1115 TaxID=1967444 RepID=A0A947DFT2_9CYAN|nr:restriction endonuclease subunit S [Leptothoe spongobia]MBT9316115.1 restriction endonuclease subunit S [Leptothoe spongobia TAU-MAC 1115]
MKGLVSSGEVSFCKIYNTRECITEKGLNNSSVKLHQPGTVLLGMIGEGKTRGQAAILRITAGHNQNTSAIRVSETGLPAKYVYYFLKHEYERTRKIGAGNNQPALNKSRVQAISFPLPPLNEQHRIVAKIEALTTRSRKARAALDAIPPLLDQFRQSVLAAAFRGDLTADWRAQNPDVEWQKTTLNEVIKGKPRNGYSPKAVDYPTKVKSFSLSATTSGEFKAEHFKYIEKDIPNDSHLWLKPGDILIQRSNTLDYVGTSAIYTGDFNEFIYPDLIMKVQVREDLIKPKYIHYLLSSKQTRDYFKANATGTAGNMPKINQKVVMNTPVLLPSIKEQSEIVHRISKVFETACSIENYFQQTEHDLTTLDQSILSKAFRGELVPQDPNDEPASVLLKRIRTEREKETKKGKGRKGKGKRVKSGE